VRDLLKTDLDVNAPCNLSVMSTIAPTIPNINVGGGRIVARSYGSEVVFSELSSTYPLKLLSPRIAQDGVALVYILSYGGGLVGGDRVNLTVDVGSGSVLVLLSQVSRYCIHQLDGHRKAKEFSGCKGSTKVFKTRPGDRASCRPQGSSTSSLTHTITSQTMNISVSPGAALFLLPDPVTCFRNASYNQIQTFRLLDDSASVVLLDWVTSGRKSLGEEWVFSRYYSVNEVWVDGKKIARDVLLLDDTVNDAQPLPKRTLKDRLAPYSCYATLLLYGPLVQDVIGNINAEYATISVFKANSPSNLVWSVSPVSHQGGIIVRIAGKETEGVKSWLGNALRKLEDIVGIDVYRRAFPP
jgi:urease accessory protein